MSRRSLALLALVLCCVSLRGLAQNPAPVAPPRSIPVLAYHRFDPATPGSTTVTLATFTSQLNTLAADGYTILPLEQVTDILLGKAPVPSRPVTAITIDDGHESVYRVLFPLIKQKHIPVTLFLYPSAISNASYALTWDQLREMRASGLVDIQCHTYWHPDFRRENKKRAPADYASFVDMQLTKSRAKLDARLGTHIDLLAWPYGILDPELEAAARHAGYRAAFAYDGLVAHAGDDAFSLHRIPVPGFLRGAGFEAALRGTGRTHPVRE